MFLRKLALRLAALAVVLVPLGAQLPAASQATAQPILTARLYEVEPCNDGHGKPYALHAWGHVAFPMSWPKKAWRAKGRCGTRYYSFDPPSDTTDCEGVDLFVDGWRNVARESLRQFRHDSVIGRVVRRGALPFVHGMNGQWWETTDRTVGREVDAVYESRNGREFYEAMLFPSGPTMPDCTSAQTRRSTQVALSVGRSFRVSFSPA